MFLALYIAAAKFNLATQVCKAGRQPLMQLCIENLPAFTIFSSSIPDSAAATPSTENKTKLQYMALTASAVQLIIAALQVDDVHKY